MIRYLISLFLFVIFSLPQSTFAYGQKEYRKVLKQWTRHDEQYGKDDLVASIIWDATYLSEELTKAQVEYYADQYGLDLQQSSSRLKIGQNKSGTAKFFILFYTNAKKYDDLALQEHGWLLRLKKDSITYEPTAVQKFKRLRPEDTFFYPHAIHWQVGYLVEFPVEDLRLTDSFSLSLHHTVGQSTLNW